MRKLVTSTGGHPFELDDISLLQTAYTDIFKAVAEGIVGPYGSTGVYLYGCLYIPFFGSTLVTPGAIYWNGQTYEVDAHLLPTLGGGQQHYFQVQQQVLAPSPVTYQDTTLHNVHIRERMVAVASVSLPASSIPKSQILRRQQIVGPPQYSTTAYVGPTTNFDFTTGLGKDGTSVFGWGLCDGRTYTLATGGTVVAPDYRGRTIVGLDAQSVPPGFSDTAYAGVDGSSRPNAVGGAKNHSLGLNEMPNHEHEVYWSVGGSGRILNGGQAANIAAGGGQHQFVANLNDTVSGSNSNPLSSGDKIIAGPIPGYTGQTPVDLRQPWANGLFIIKLY